MRLFDMVHYGSIRVSRIVYVIGVDSVFLNMVGASVLHFC